MIKESIKQLVEGYDLSYEDACNVMKKIMSGESTEAQISAVLTALRMKGETPSEISAFASVMRKFCRQINPKVRGRLVDTCGTGGDSLKTFNISTVSAIVAAGAGVNIAKHGNRSFTSKCGSADVLENLGVNLYLEPEEVEESIEKIGIGFIYAPSFHPAMKYAVEPRRQLGIRTVFNVLGPLTNPASAEAQLLGVYDHKLTRPLAESLKILGCEEAMVVHGLGGMDEISTLGETKISWLKDGEVNCKSFNPVDFGIKKTTHEAIKGSDVRENSEIVYRILNGHDNGPRTDIVLVNSMAGIIVSGKTDEMSHAIELAKESIESGSAYGKLKDLVRQTGGNTRRLEELEKKHG
mgnify:CR=1 FL=1